jgi:hypothetical protein
MKVKLLITDEAKWVAYGPCRVLQVFGNNNHTADNFIQFHEKPLAGLTAGDVPAVASIFAPASAPFDWKPTTDITLSELTIAVSSTNVNYTALTNQGVDATVIVETDFPVGSNTTLVGDLTSADKQSRQIWASSSTNTKRLLRVDVVNADAQEIFMRVSASDSKLTGDTTTIPHSIPASTTKSFYFGRDGYSPFRLDADGTEHKGCTVFLMNSADPSSGLIAVPTGSIRAIYDV